ncbi:MAG: hypothetical protein Q7J54_03890 [Candidatus Woesearchaeota archaeon]|nr:hypothetical protein [Candidatus Woesearchaeota archaeon]
MSEYLESLAEAKEELKRVDHLIYVSLKYTRTVDVIKSIVERMINAFDCSIRAGLEYAKEKKKIKAIPANVVERCNVFLNLFKSEEYESLKDYVDFYILLRKIDRAHFERAREFRRHVTMTAFLEEGEIEIDIDIITEYYHKIRKFISIIESIIYPPKDEND